MVNKSGDPIAFWQQMVGEMQKSFTAFTRLRPIGAARSSDDPATSGNGQKPMADLMENYYAGMNVPSRGQLTALNERLAVIEGELAETRTLLKELLTATKLPAPAPKPAADLAPQLNEIKGLLDKLVAASKSVPAPADVRPELNEIKGLLDRLVAASQAPQPEAKPAVDVTPQLSEIKALLGEVLNAAKEPPLAPVALEAEPEQSAESPPKEALKAAELPRQGKARNKKPGAGHGSQGAETRSGG
ncbi:hypothetical protein ACQR1I_23480 [Bradyrhizobium sp. HKCCYLS2038]|uniref:hypothetical protein n=1 Tax=unclassified Bradyrhizobium TaxID=2631580 RepID=UPI003EBC3188